jgi:hypothetical protein
MARYTDNSFDMLKVGLQLDRIISFPYRNFLMYKVFLTYSSPTYYTNPNSIRIFAFSGAFVTFHIFSSISEELFLSPNISMSKNM